MRRRIAVEDVVALLDGVAVLQMERLALRDQVLDRLQRRIVRLDDDAALVLVVAPEADRAVDLGDDGVILRTARLEQFGHTRQTAGDVLGLGAFHRDTRDHVARPHLGARLDRQDRLDREHGSGHRRPSTACRPCPWRRGWSIAGLRSLPRGVERQSMTSRLVMPVDLSAVSCTEMPSTRSSKATLPSISVRIGRVYGIPLGDALAALHLVAVVDEDARTVGDAVRGALLAGLVEDQHRHVAAHHHRAGRRSCAPRCGCGSRPCPRRRLPGTTESTTCAVPPMWKVRMVSWVPGSPIDCAAMTPTASPILTGVPRARSRP